MRTLQILMIISACLLVYTVNSAAAGNTTKLKLMVQGAKKGMLDEVAVGVVANNTSTDLITFAQIDCAALDKTGNILDTGRDDLSNIQPGETAYTLVPFAHLNSFDAEFKCRVSDLAP